MQSSTCPALSRPRSPVSILDWQRQILKLSDLTTGEKAAAIALSHYINGRSGYAWPSLATIADSCGVGEQTVRRAIRKLESLGMLRSETRSGTSNRYHLDDGTTEVETPIACDTPPLTPAIPEPATERATPPNPPTGGHVDKPTTTNPSPYHRRTRRTRTPEPVVFAGCHRPADPEYLSPPPARGDRRAAAAAVGGLRAALGRLE